MPVSRARRLWLITLTVVLSALALGIPNQGAIRRVLVELQARLR